MRIQARAVVISGGVVGISVPYHLAKIGWTDVLPPERNELTSGSPWHSAGGMHTSNGDANVSRPQKYTIDLYRQLAALSGQSRGPHPYGGLMLEHDAEKSARVFGRHHALSYWNRSRSCLWVGSIQRHRDLAAS